MSNELEQRITNYLASGGLVNPEMAIHTAVRDLLIDCRAALAAVPTTQASPQAVPQEPKECPHGLFDVCCENHENCNLGPAK